MLFLWYLFLLISYLYIRYISSYTIYLKSECTLAVYLACSCLSTGKKARSKAPKIQRLVTSVVLQRKRHRLALKKRRSTKKREDAADYQKLLAQRLKEAKERKLERRRTMSHSKSSVSRESQSSATPAVVAAAKK